MPDTHVIWVLLGLSLLFATLALREYLTNDRKFTIAAKAWRKMAVIMGLVAGLLAIVE